MSTSTQISEIPSKKARKTDHDHISNLPDCVISHILSRLPTRDAVRTSVLSKDWEYKWTSVYKIELSSDRVTVKKEKDIFANFVERTLLLAQNVQKFSLSSNGKHDKHRMRKWVSAALSRNVHCLQLYYRNANFVLPDNPFNCYSLRELELNMTCTLKVPEAIGLPHLTTLRLENVEVLNEVSNSDVLKFNFPVLVSFEVIDCKWSNVKFVEIYAPKMTSFKSYTPFGARVYDYSIQITGGSIVNFESSGEENIVLTGGSEVVYAAIRKMYEHEHEHVYYLEKLGLQVRKLLKGFLNLKDLELCDHVPKAIALSKLGVSLPRYYKMKRLVIKYVGRNIEGLLELLHAAPFLKILDISMSPCGGGYDNEYDMDENLPSCIVSHLERVKFSRCFGVPDELKLAKFFLRNAVQLKSLYIHRWRTKKENYKMGRVLSAYPRASTCSTIVIRNDLHVLKF